MIGADFRKRAVGGRLLGFFVACSCLLLLASAVGADRAAEMVIIDTDIGSDVDDAFAVALALKSPELTVLGFSTTSGDTLARAKVIDRMLGESGRADIPVAVGAATTLPYGSPLIGRQKRYGEGGHFAKASHPAAVDFILSQIHWYPQKITLVAIGPLTNLAALIDKDPNAFRQLRRVVMMGGSIDVGYDSSSRGPVAEYNIDMDIAAAQKVFASGVPITMMPLDSTIQLKLDKVKRDSLFSQGTPLTDSLAILYLMWGNQTPILYDAMPLAYLLDPGLCPTDPMRIVVDDRGVMHSQRGKSNVEVCLHSDANSFLQFYLQRLTRVGDRG